jgi:hypothetical protein
LRLFTPCIPVGPQIGDHAAQLSEQHVGCRVGCRGDFRLSASPVFRAEAVTVGVEVSGQLGAIDHEPSSRRVADSFPVLIAPNRLAGKRLLS